MWLTIFIAIPLSNLTAKAINWLYAKDICETCLSFWMALCIGYGYSLDLYQALGYAGVTWVSHRVMNQFIMEL
jgi:hypothetical protein